MAHYITNELGVIDLTRHSSVGGSYKGCYPMGLVTGLSAVLDKYKHIRLHRADPMEPWTVRSNIYYL